MTFGEYLIASWHACGPNGNVEEMSQRCHDYNELLLLIDRLSEPSETGKKLTWFNQQLEQGKAAEELVARARTIYYEYYEVQTQRPKIG